MLSFCIDNKLFVDIVITNRYLVYQQISLAIDISDYCHVAGKRPKPGFDEIPTQIKHHDRVWK